MACYRNLIFFFVLILSSCAQVGTISGGDKDIYAPQPNLEKATPKNGSVNFKGNHVEIPFNEYFRLNNPSQTIKIVPPHTTIKAEVSKKTLLLHWDDQLQENTTYAIYLNNALKDITEGNDSIIQYVFSTGQILDSLTYSGQVLDAWTRQPVKGCVIALYKENSNELVSFCESDNLGNYQLNYLHQGKYTLLAFVDENIDLVHQKHEKVGFPIKHSIDIETSIVDTIPLLMFHEVGDPKITSQSYNAPGIFTIAANHSLETASFRLNNVNIDTPILNYLAEDSVELFLSTTELQSVDIVVESNEIRDTLKFRITKDNRSAPIRIKTSKKNNTFAPSEKIEFIVNDLITSIDTSLIEVVNIKDSIRVTDYSFTLNQNKLIFNLERDSIQQYSLLFKNQAVLTSHGETSEQFFNVQLKPIEKYGTLRLDLSFYSDPILIYVQRNGSVSTVIPVSSPSTLLLEELEPGDYTFKVVSDANGNKKWDAGNMSEYIQPEKIDFYSEKINVRANWEVEAALIPSK